MTQAISSTDPNAPELIKAKIAKLEKQRDDSKTLNALVRKHKTHEALTAAVKQRFPDFKDPERMAQNLLTPDYAGRVGIPSYVLTNLGSEIRRLKKRLEEVPQAAAPFEPFDVGPIKVLEDDGRIQVHFPFKPDEDTRKRLKGSPLAFKWSPTREAWVRQKSPATGSTFFKTTLQQVLLEARP